MRVIAFVLSMMLVASLLGTSAFTSATVSRDTNIDVVTDDTGIIALTDGTNHDIVAQKSSGELTIDFTNAGNNVGVNVDSIYELGDRNSASTRTAFNITNQDTAAHTLTLEYSGFDEEQVAGNQIEFRVYNDAGTHIQTLSDESTSITISDVASGQTLKVVVVIDTHGMTSSGDLSGTLDISAS